jgi:ferredoxin
VPGATLLEAGLAAGAPMPFSCGVGGCGSCRVKLTSGDVELEEPNCLSEAERAAGYVLACVGRPCGPCTIGIEEASDVR